VIEEGTESVQLQPHDTIVLVEKTIMEGNVQNNNSNQVENLLPRISFINNKIPTIMFSLQTSRHTIIRI